MTNQTADQRTDMTESQKQLREAAEAATPGPWQTDYWDEESRRNSEYIALANPSAILELLAALERAEADAARYRWLRQKDSTAIVVMPAPPDDSWCPYLEQLDAAIDMEMGVEYIKPQPDVPPDQSAVLAENEPSIGTRLWLWKNFVDGKPEYWAFDNAYPCYANGDPMTLGEPCGYAIVRPSTNGRPEVSDEQVADQSAVLAENEACAKAVANIPAPADDRASLYILGHAAALRSANEAIRARHK